MPETHYTQPLIPLVLGLDPGLMRLGFAFTELVTGAPRWCGTVPIYEKDMGWRERQLRQALQRIQATLLSKPEAHFLVAHIAIEKMFVGPNGGTALELSEVAGQAAGICGFLWPEPQIDRFFPAEWRKLNDLPGNAPKGDVYAHAQSLGFKPPALCGKCPRCKDHCGQDAADASLISRAGQLTALARQPRAAAAVADVEGAPV